MNLVGEKVILRALDYEGDADLLFQWANEPEIWNLLGGWHVPYTYLSTQEWIRSLQKDSNNLHLGITLKNSGTLVGTANIVDIDWKNGNAFHGMMIADPNTRGKGIGKDTVLTVMDYAFNTLRLNRLDGSMIDYNNTSIDFYTLACGWKREGIQRNWYFRHGQYWDKVLVGITKEDYQSFMASK